MMKGNQKICNLCESPMKRRMKQTGTDAGIEFWVCSRFPECRNVEKCDPSKVQKPDAVKITTGDRPSRLSNMDQKEQPYAKVALFFGSAVIFAFVVAGAMNKNLTQMIFGEIGARTTETGLIDYPRVQSVAIEPIQVAKPTNITEQAQPENISTGSIYRFTDDNGIIVMVSELEKVPSRFRANMKVLQSDNSKATVVIIKDNNRVFVPVTIGYHGKMVTVPLLIDTGATGIMISPAIAQRLGIGQETTTQGSSVLADGRKVINYNAIADFVAVGPKTKSALQVHIMPNENSEATGLLGMSFLADFPHMIDVKSSVIKWM